MARVSTATTNPVQRLLRAGLALLLICAAAPTWAQQQAGAVFNRVADSVGIVLVFNLEGRLVASGSAVTVGIQTMVTNHHVVPPQHTYMVLAGGYRYDATIGLCDDVQDLCLLNVPGLESRPVEFGPSDKLEVGDPVYAIGAPNEVRNMMAVSAVTKQKTISPPQLTLSNGLVTALRPVEDVKIIQTNAAISPGSSGGGLFDANGRLIGITTFQMRDAQGLNMALPVDWIQRLGATGASPRSDNGSTAPPVSQIADSSPVAPTRAEPETPGAKPAATAPIPETFPSRWIWLAAAIVVTAVFIVLRRRGGDADEEDHVVEPDPVLAEFAALAAGEIESNNVHAELWNQLVLDHKGDVNATREAYIRRRASILVAAEKDKRWADAVRQNQAA